MSRARIPTQTVEQQFVVHVEGFFVCRLCGCHVEPSFVPEHMKRCKPGPDIAEANRLNEQADRLRVNADECDAQAAAFRSKADELEEIAQRVRVPS